MILLAQEKNGPVARAKVPRERNIPMIFPFSSVLPMILMITWISKIKSTKKFLLLQDNKPYFDIIVVKADTTVAAPIGQWQ